MQQRFTLLLLLIIPTLCTLGVDVSQLFTTSTYQCIKNGGHSFVIIRAYQSNGQVDAHAVSNLNNAKAAGLKTDVYFFPCRGKSATAQVDQMVAAISSSLYGTIWLDIETNPSSGCGWSSDHNSNCVFLSELISRVKSHGKVAGIYASKVMWTNIMGSASACPAAGSQ
jgi:GH25 family lysozyme M1 (1,4-beta-N-acetylmuramidase)